MLPILRDHAYCRGMTQPSEDGEVTTADAEIMTTTEVAEYLRVPVPTVYRWRNDGHGPTASRVGRHLRYRRSEVDAWLNAQRAS